MNKILYILGPLLSSILLGYTISLAPIPTLLTTLGIAGTFLLLKNHHLGLILILIATLAGQFSRLPFGPGLGFLANDLFLPVLIVIWLIKKITHDRTFKSATIGFPLFIFLTVAFFSLLNSLTFLTTEETLRGSFYLIRLIEYIFLYFIALDLINSEKVFLKYRNGIILFGALLALTGFAQLAIYPDFKEMQDFGWDPHKDRLLATWFDPNFVGGALTFILSLGIGSLLYSKKNRLFLAAACGLMLIALLLTYSRSAYLAFAIAFALIGFIKSRKFLIVSILAALLLVSTSSRAQQRISDMYFSALSLLNTESVENPDATARLRVQSWLETFQVIQKYPLLGTGYNTYQYVQIKEGNLKDASIHSASGSDSSLLTILATTGVLGFFPFLLIFLTLIKKAFTQLRKKETSLEHQGYTLGLIGGVTGLIAHSFFVNSLFFPFIMVIMWVSIGVWDSQKSKSNT